MVRDRGRCRGPACIGKQPGGAADAVGGQASPGAGCAGGGAPSPLPGLPIGGGVLGVTLWTGSNRHVTVGGFSVVNPCQPGRMAWEGWEHRGRWARLHLGVRKGKWVLDDRDITTATGWKRIARHRRRVPPPRITDSRSGPGGMHWEWSWSWVECWRERRRVGLGVASKQAGDHGCRTTSATAGEQSSPNCWHDVPQEHVVGAGGEGGWAPSPPVATAPAQGQVRGGKDSCAMQAVWLGGACGLQNLSSGSLAEGIKQAGLLHLASADSRPVQRMSVKGAATLLGVEASDPTQVDLLLADWPQNQPVVITSGQGCWPVLRLGSTWFLLDTHGDLWVQPGASAHARLWRWDQTDEPPDAV